MPSHHHDGGCHRRHHNHHENISVIPNYYATSSSSFCAHSTHCCCTQSNQASSPNLDRLLLRLIASYLQNQQETQCSCKTQSSRFKQSFLNQEQHKKKNVQREYDYLLRKIDDLEFSLNRLSACYYRDSYSTLKDSAARVIQSHFRSHLVRRSISLRQLKELATIKSSFLSLKSSVSDKLNFPFEAVSREATDLLMQLDSIQDRVDPMIRDEKRSLSRDIVRFLHYSDDCAVKRRDTLCKSANDVSFTSKCKSSSVVKRYVGTERSKKQIKTIYVTPSGDEAELEEFRFMTDDCQKFPIVSVESSRKVTSSNVRVEGNKVKTPVTKTVKFGKNRNIYELTSSAEDEDGETVMMMSRDDGVGCSNPRDRSSCSAGGKTRVMKTMSFHESGNVYKVYRDTPETSVSGGDDSSTSGSNNKNGLGYNEVENLKFVTKENVGFKEEEEDTHSENEEECSSEGSEEEAQVIENVSQTGRNEHTREFQLRKGSSMFSPPLPLKMEP